MRAHHCVVLLLNHVHFATHWTVAHQAPLSMGFPSKTTRVGFHFLMQGIFWPRDWTRGSCISCIGRGMFLPLSHRGNSEAKIYVDKYLRWLCNGSVFQQYICVKHISQKMKCRSRHEIPQPPSCLWLTLIHQGDLQKYFFVFMLYSKSFLAIYFIFLTFSFISAIAD